MNAFDCIILIVAALGITGFGILWLFAEGMADTDQKSGLGGCLTTLVGLALTSTMIWLLIDKLI